MTRFAAKLTTILLISSLLSGCVAAVVATGAAIGVAATTVMYDKRSVKTIYHDEQLTNLIQTRIDANPEFDRHAHVTATAYQGWVLLVGQAATASLRQEIIDTVKTTQGIARLYDEIQIQAPISQLQQSKDVWITTQVKTKLLQIQGLKSSQIKITTENGVVYLMGIVTSQQATSAVDAISHVEGVKKVVKIFDVVNNNKA